MMHLRLSAFLALVAGALLLAIPARAQAVDPDLAAANQAYQDGKYADAAKLFQQLIATRGYSAPLCFDLGNAQLKAGQLGQALLQYERARYLAPADSGINHNLQLARRQAGLDPDPYRWWEVVIRSIDWTVWLGIIAACLILLLLAMIGRANAPGWSSTTGTPVAFWRKVFKTVFFVCIPLALFFAFVELSAAGFNDRIEGVVVAKPATLRLSPFESAEKTGTVPEGQLVTVEEHHNDYLWIDERSRQSGWVQQKEVEPIVPGSFDQPTP
jgi:tetratricopeptide (TPR) repeat protein